MKEAYVIGVDFGTDSVRAILVDAYNGKEIGAKVSYFEQWKTGKYCDPQNQQFRQHPQDYIQSLKESIMGCLAGQPEPVKASVMAIAIDATGSTPVAVNRAGLPLALDPAFSDNPNAMFFLWKDHTSIQEAMEINEKAKKFEPNYLSHVGGSYSSEWFWSKLLYVARHDPQVIQATYAWVEQSDWLPYWLTGGEDADLIKRNVCAAGHKGLWAKAFGGYPARAFFEELDEGILAIYDRMNHAVFEANELAGTLSEHWAEQFGLSSKVLIAVGAIDAHVGAIGAEIEPGQLCKVMGTSTCDMIVISEEELQGKLVEGICGQVVGSIVPGLVGLEAGQSAFGDVYQWFKQVLLWPLQHMGPEVGLSPEQLNQISDTILMELSTQASKLEIKKTDPISLDWLNGRRTPFVNPYAKGAIVDISLGSNAVDIFKSLVEATCFGSRAIVADLERQGIPISSVTAIGGIAKKSSYVMQTLADVLQRPICVHQSNETCALGACMLAATAAGIHTNLAEAMKHMGLGFEKTYTPNQGLAELYQFRFNRYQQLGEQLYH